MKNLIKSRRGIAIEMAIGAMFIMIALSIVLISISGMQTQYMKNDLQELNEKIECYEITDYILKNHKLGETIREYSDSNYVIVGTEIEGTIDEYEYTVTKNGNVVLTLTIKTDTNSNKNTVISWGN